ncbi:MAG: hypothetical protein CO108_18010, partial [Deltaproteobacteria bacterium CG_4_9_14_3_um_filter_63_12]
ILPSATPGASAAANVMAGLVSGTFDAAVWAGLKAIPLAGIVPMALDAIKGTRDAFADAKTTNDDGNLSEAILGVRLVREAADFIGSAASNIGDTASLLEDAAAASVIGAEIAPFAAVVGEVARGVALGCSAFKISADTFMLVGNVFLSRRLAAEGKQEGSDKAMSLAGSNAFAAISDSISFIGDFVGLATANVAGGGAAVARMGTAMAQKGATSSGVLAGEVAHTALGKAGEQLNPFGSGKNAARGAGAIGSGLGLTGNTSINTTPARALRAGAGGEAATIIGPAREATNGLLSDSAQGLEGSKPVLWHQKLIDDFKKEYGFSDAASDALDWVTSPSAWVTAFFNTIPFSRDIASWLIGVVGDNPEVVAGAIQNIIPGGDLLQPVLTGVSEWISTHADDIKGMSADFNATMQEHQLSLEVIQDALGMGRNLLTSVSGLTDAKGPIERTAHSLINQLDHMKAGNVAIPPITVELLRTLAPLIPGLGPIVSLIAATPIGSLVASLLEQARAPIERFINSWVARWNRQVEELIATATEAADQKLAEIDAVIDENTAQITGWIAQLEAEFADGGQVQQLLQAQYEKVQAMVAAADAAIQAWDGTLDLTVEGGVQWLAAVAQAVVDHLDATRGHNNEELKQQWTEVLDGEAQPWVTAWKTAHSQEVMDIAYPVVPGEEVAAALRAASAVDAQITTYENSLPPGGHTNVVQRYRTMVGDIRGTIQGTQNGRGESALQTLWSAEDRLITLESQLGSQASQASRGDNQGLVEELRELPSQAVAAL